MKKHLLLSLLFLAVTFASRAQFYSFEDGVVPSDWVAGAGDVLSVADNHYKDDTYSLKWTTSGNNALTVSFPSFQTTTTSGASLQIYSTAITNQTLKVEFISTTNLVLKTANYKLNYKGWRDFTRKYNEYAATGVNQLVAKVRFTLITSGAGTTTLYFDRVDFNASVSANRTPGPQWLDDVNYFGATNNVTPLTLYSFPRDIVVSAPSAQEITDLTLLRQRSVLTPAKPTSAVLGNAIAFVDGLSITRNADGTPKGVMIDNDDAKLTTAVMADYALKLEALAYDYLNNPTDNAIQTRFNNFFDHLMEQGIAEGCSFSISTTDYTNARNIPSRFLNVLPACTDARKVELIKFVRWFSYYYALYFSQSDYLKNLNSDIIYLYLPYFTATAIHNPDVNAAVGDLKALKRFLDRNSEYVPGGRDILKPDGTGFHHNTHYNNYMYSYQTWVDNIHVLRGTAFQIDAESYNRIKKAVLSVYRMATLDTGDANRYYALSLAGRNPFESGQSLFFTKILFEQLIETGTEIMGRLDNELAGAYNYFYQSNKYLVPINTQEGFYQFNYSPLAIYRKGDWVVTMRAPTTKFWGAEIYDKQNRFGRYQSHGTLEVMYPGNLIKSGYPTNGTGGGWDWNMPQGGTTVKYTAWQDLMPSGNVTARFDQFAKTKNFAGALAWGDKGIFASDFDQDDNWGAQRFTPTNLKFKKSMFAYDGMIVSLGTDISAQGSYNDSWNTFTTLFQNIYSSNFSTQQLVVNGSAVASGYTASLPANADNWFITPSGTGYFVPAGNENVNVSLEAQKTPKQDGSDYANPATSATAAKAYINHGVKPAGKSYQFVVLPGATNASMQSFSQNYTNLVRVNQKNGSVHSVTFLQDNTHAYTFFEPTFGLNVGKVKSVGSRMLLMENEQTDGQKVLFAASCPDLNPVSDPDYNWRSTPQSSTIVLAGEWQLENDVDGVTLSAPVNGETNATLTFNDGEPIYFNVIKYGTGIRNIEIEKYVDYYVMDGELAVIFKDESRSDRQLSIYSIDGKSVLHTTVSGHAKSFRTAPFGNKNSVYICKIKSAEYILSFKVKL